MNWKGYGLISCTAPKFAGQSAEDKTKNEGHKVAQS